MDKAKEGIVIYMRLGRGLKDSVAKLNYFVLEDALVILVEQMVDAIWGFLRLEKMEGF